MIRCWVAGWVIAVCGAASAVAATIYVDDDAAGDPGPGDPLVSDPLADGSAAHPFDAIQEALDASLSGDEIIVADGTYSGPGNRDLDFVGRAVTLHSASGDPATCVIGCELNGRGFSFHSGETADTVVNGFTILQGRQGGSGAGVYCLQGSPTLANCVIATGSAGAYGGGVYSSGALSRPTLVNCTISGNSANVGGGVYCDQGSSATLIDCRILQNSARYGGGIACRQTDRVALTRCQVIANLANVGGGLYCQIAASPTLRSCLVAGNRANSAGGGALCLYASSPVLIGCALVGNTAGSDGSAVYCRFSSNPALVHCTITENEAVDGGAIACYGESNPTLTNSILWANTQQAISLISGDPVLTFCDIFGGWPGDGNIDADPFFVGTPYTGPDGHWGTPDDDYGDLHLSPGSPCIDAGDNENPPRDDLDADGDGCVTEPWPVDLAADARYVDDPDMPDTGRGVTPIADLGAYEYGATSTIPPTPCPGDLNCDGVVDAADVGAFVMALIDPTGYPAAFPGCPWLGADLNNDGAVDFEDINPFVEVLSAV